MYYVNLFRCEVCDGREVPCILVVKSKSEVKESTPKECPFGYESEWKRTSEIDAGLKVHE